MKPLSREASAALSALKAAEPTSEDEARVRKNLERALGVAIPVAGVAAVTTAAGAQAATSGFAALGLGAKVALVVVAVSTVSVVAAVSFERADPQHTQPPKPTVIAAPPAPAPEVVAVVPVPARDEPRQPVTPSGVEGPTRPVKPRPQPKPPEPEVAMVEVAVPELPEPVVAAPPPPTAETWNLEVEANFPNCDAATELRSATSARKLLTADRAEDAVWLLGAYQRRCPSGRWSDEAWAVRMAGLCKLGRTAEVIGLLQWFSAEYPARRAAVVADLRSSCSDDVLSPSPRGARE